MSCFASKLFDRQAKQDEITRQLAVDAQEASKEASKNAREAIREAAETTKSAALESAKENRLLIDKMIELMSSLRPATPQYIPPHHYMHSQPWPISGQPANYTQPQITPTDNSAFSPAQFTAPPLPDSQPGTPLSATPL